MKIDYFSRYLKYKQKYLELKGGAVNYYLYLTLEDEATPGLEWGGTHITIAGRGNSKEALKRISPNFNSGSPEWTLSRTSNLAIDQGLNALRFDSRTLDALSQQLVGEGVVNVKGPIGNATHHNPWFIRFPPHEVLPAKLAEFRAGPKMWHLTICTETIEHGNSVFTWERLSTRPTARRIGFDFDGVIHTSVDNDLWSRNPLNHNRRDNPCFQLICDKIRDYHRRGYEIFIITARTGQPEIIRDNLTHCGITPAMIPDSNIRTIGNQSKADLAIQLGLEEFHDDSQRQINDFTSKASRLPTPFTLFKAFPERNAIQIVLQK